MDYWPSARWKIGLLTDGVQHWVEPPGPLALIGAHPCCAARIDEKRVAPVAYIACCFEDSVEVWPVRPLAFDRWGIVDAHHELIVGQTHVTLVHQTHSAWPRVSGGEQRLAGSGTQEATGLLQDPLPQILLEWGGKVRPKPLFRRVTIIGQDHPSTLRMYGLGMQRCDHAIIAVGGWLGLVNLTPGIVARVENLVTRLTPETPPVTMGRVTVSVGEESAATPTSVLPPDSLAESSKLGSNARPDIPEAIIPEAIIPTVIAREGISDGLTAEASEGTRANDTAAASELPAERAEPTASTAPKHAAIGNVLFPVTRAAVEKAAAEPSPRAAAEPSPQAQPSPRRTPGAQTLEIPTTAEKPPQKRRPATQPSNGQASRGRLSEGQTRKTIARVTKVPATRVAPPAKVSAAVRDRRTVETNPDSLSSQLTDRLITIDQNRSMHRRILLQSAYTAAFLGAAILLVWVIIAKVLPMVGE